MVEVLEQQAYLVPVAEAQAEPSVEESRRLYAQERVFWNRGAPDLPSVTEGYVPGPAGDILIRLYRPLEKGILPVLIYLHGGGFVVGNLNTHDRIMRLLARDSGYAVLGVDYRLSPEHRFPTAIEETMVVARYLLNHGPELDLDPHRIAMGGDSAGANLSLAAALGFRDTSPDLLKCLLLYYGTYGLRDSRSLRLFGGPEDGLSPKDFAFYRSCYLPSDVDSHDFRIDMLGADLGGLPPVFLAAAEFDPLLDDSLTLKELLDRNEVKHELKVYTGVLHGFLHYGLMLDAAGRAIEDGATALGRWC
jgi:acetyl esterase